MPPPTVGTAEKHFTAEELAALKLPGVPSTKRGVAKRATSESWPYKHRIPEGGGVAARIFPVTALPEEARVELARRQAAPSAEAREGAALALPRRLSAEVALEARAARRADGLEDLQALPAWAREVAEARCAAVFAFARFAETAGLRRSDAYARFVALCKEGVFDLGPAVQRDAGALSARTLRRWEAAMKKGGVVALAPSYGKRSARAYEAKVDALTPLRDLVLGSIKEAGPHLNVRVLRADLVARFGEENVPKMRSLQEYVQRWRGENPQVAAYLDSPALWRNRVMPAYGRLDEGIVRLNQVWELDSTIADVALAERLPGGKTGTKRYSLVGVIDVFSRRAMYLVCRTSSSAAIRLLLRRAVLAWGMPETIRMDNGKDYTSKALDLFAAQIGVKVQTCAPFHPEEKPFIERMYRTLQHGEMERLPGFVGHSVTEQMKRRARQEERARKDAGEAPIQLGTCALTALEFEAWISAWCEQAYGARRHETLGMSPNERAAQHAHQARTVRDAALLDMLLDPVPDTGRGEGVRVAGKKGIQVGRLADGQPRYHIAPELARVASEEVMCFVDPYAPGRIAVHRRSTMEFVCWAESELDGIERRRVAIEARSGAKDVVKNGMRLLTKSAKAAQVGDAWLHIMAAHAERHGGDVAMPGLAAASDAAPTPGMEAARDAAGARTVLDAERVLRQELTESERASLTALEVSLLPDLTRPRFWDSERHRCEWLEAHPDAWTDDDSTWYVAYKRGLLGEHYGAASVG